MNLVAIREKGGSGGGRGLHRLHGMGGRFMKGRHSEQAPLSEKRPMMKYRKARQTGVKKFDQTYIEDFRG